MAKKSGAVSLFAYRDEEEMFAEMFSFQLVAEPSNVDFSWRLFKGKKLQSSYEPCSKKQCEQSRDVMTYLKLNHFPNIRIH